MQHKPDMIQEASTDFQIIFSALPGNFLVLMPEQPHYKILAASDELLQLTRQNRDAIVGKSIMEALSGVFEEGFEHNLKNVLQEVTQHKTIKQTPAFLLHTQAKTRAKNTKSWVAEVKAVKDKVGEVAYLLLSIAEVASEPKEVPVSADKRPEEDLNKIATAVEAGEMGVFEIDVKANKIKADEQFNRIYGFDAPQELESYESCLHTDDLAVKESAVEASINTGKLDYEARILLNNKEVRWIKCKARVYLDDAGQLSRIVGVVQDITDQKTLEKSLRESEAWLQAIIEATPECIKIVDNNGTLQFMNQSGLEMIEGGRELMGNACVFDVIAPEHQLEWVKNHKQVCKGKSLSWEFDVIGLKGTRRRMETHAVPLPVNGGTTHLGVTRDITGRKNSEAALRESEERFRVFANNIQNLAWMAEPNGWIFWYNERWYDYTGTNLEEMLGWGWAKVHHPDHIDRIINFLQDAWTKGETWELTFPLRGADGVFRWFLTRAYAVKDEQGRVIRWIGTNTNVDEQKKAEAALEQKNAELTRINNDLDNFIYTASHDLKAPISNIEGLLKLVSDDFSSGNESEIKYMLTLMQGSVNRFKKTIESLTDVVKLQQEHSGVATVVNLSQVVSEVMQDLDPMINEAEAKVVVNINENHVLQFSEKNLRSVVYNLLCNAIKYRSPNRVPEILLNCHTTPEHYVLTVKDNGLGMKTGPKHQLFTMFKRFHDHVEGSGIGLYMVKKIMDNAGGHIEVESQVGVGSTFKVYFKRHSGH